MYRSRFAFALAMAALATVLLHEYSEGSPITFERTYGGAGDDLGFSVQQTTDSGYIVTGVLDGLSDSSGAYLVKTNAHGDTLWTRTFGGAQRAAAGSSVRQTTDGGYIVVGGVDSSGPNPSGIWLIKTDAHGDTLWTRIYAGPNGASMVEQTADGGYVIVGNTSYSGPSGADVYLIKTDARGETLWTRAYGGANDDVGNSIQQTTDGGYIIAANTMSFGAGSQDVWLIKTDSMGDTVWASTFGGDSLDYAGSAQQTADGDYIVAGYTFSYSASPLIYLIKTDAAGETLWTKTIGGPGWVEGSPVEQVSDGGYIIAGICGTVLPDVYLVRTDANGDTLWTRTFGGHDFDAGYSVQQTTDGGFVIAGQTYSYGAGASDFYLIKTDAAGNVAVAEPKERPTRVPALTLSCEPNPCRGATRISFKPQASSSKPLTLRVYDAQGRVVRSLSTLLSPPSSLTWEGTDDLGRALPSGGYFVRSDAGSEHATTRVVLQR